MNSYTQHIKKNHNTKQRVLSILKWQENQFTDFQYRMGCQYLQGYISKDPDMIDKLVCNRIFWNWWRNQWLLRDIPFVDSNIDKVSYATALSIYLNLHDPEVLVHSIYPGGAILEESYAAMMGNVIKSETK